MDFKGPLPNSSRHNQYLLMVNDEYSRFPFAFACSDTSASSVIKGLCSLFSLFGFPSFVHSDPGSVFMRKELKDYLHGRGTATSHTTPYHPTGISQCERYNKTVYNTILMLNGRKLGLHLWEDLLPEALHAVRTLLCTAAIETPHERFFPFPQKSMLGDFASFLVGHIGQGSPKKVCAQQARPMCEDVEIVDANPRSSLVRFPDGRETTVPTSGWRSIERQPKSDTVVGLKSRLRSRGRFVQQIEFNRRRYCRDEWKLQWYAFRKSGWTTCEIFIEDTSSHRPLWLRCPTLDGLWEKVFRSAVICF